LRNKEITQPSGCVISARVLKEFFEKLSMEEQKMLATEWDWNEALRVRWEEAWEDGREKTHEKDIQEFSSLISQASSLDDLKKMFEASLKKSVSQ
jgi:hypothetical protein